MLWPDSSIYVPLKHGNSCRLNSRTPTLPSIRNFDDVRTLAEYDAGEIQLESLKLLPGTEMRRRADELGIQYSPLPPYEVLQTREITVDELQTAHYLSRLLDGFYNTPTWRNITRILIWRTPFYT